MKTTIDNAIKRVQHHYDSAIKFGGVNKPISYALYQTLLEFDKKEKEKVKQGEK